MAYRLASELPACALVAHLAAPGEQVMPWMDGSWSLAVAGWVPEGAASRACPDRLCLRLFPYPDPAVDWSSMSRGSHLPAKNLAQRIMRVTGMTPSEKVRP